MTPSLPPVPLLCHPCLMTGRVHRARTVAGGAALCVRCAVERETDDDMSQHDLVARLYEELRAAGHGDAY